MKDDRYSTAGFVALTEGLKMSWLDAAIEKQRENIKRHFEEPLLCLARDCGLCWGDRTWLHKTLSDFICKRCPIPVRLVYVIDPWGRQVSGNVGNGGVDEAFVGQNLSDRPYLTELLPTVRKAAFDDPLFLSGVYVDAHTRKPCITTLAVVSRKAESLGLLAVDIEVKDLPLIDVDLNVDRSWRQIKGDPSIRGALFQQARYQSSMDIHLDEVLAVIESLMVEQGIFHAKLHFSTSRATLWSVKRPYDYDVQVLDEIIDPRICLAYEKIPYPSQAKVKAKLVSAVLEMFKQLRQGDDTIYLRSASLNIMNAMIGLNFSCDGTHYMTVDDFLSKDIEFWFGGATHVV